MKPQSFCPEKYRKVSDNYFVETTTACFRFDASSDTIDYYKARDECLKDWGNLASITNAKENYIVTKKLQNLKISKKFWLGLCNWEEAGKMAFKWEDNSSSRFTFWANSYDSQTDKHTCAVLDNTDASSTARADIYVAVTTDAATTVATDDSNRMTTKAAFVYTTDRFGAFASKPPDMKTNAPLILTPANNAPAPVMDAAASSLLIDEDDECIFDCPDLDCGMEGFEVADNGCQLCKCNE
ncbi:layilin [Elysia marginata]|uniref:Layilin n=1 Tax=Elysia marginata TaxID=1093978 RepID=A0AAV4I9X7_9GAST|nr:layilin [Elysia marginata]